MLFPAIHVPAYDPSPRLVLIGEYTGAGETLATAAATLGEEYVWPNHQQRRTT
jgi:hypothetical protein